MKVIIATVILATVAAIAAVQQPAAHLPACTHEDGSGGPTPCVWDGSERGNGIGRSYVVHAVDGEITYTD